MTQVSFGQFFEAFEDANALPLKKVFEEEVQSRQPTQREIDDSLRSGAFGTFFGALERANHPQMESSDSLMSLATSLKSFSSANSLSSMGSEKKEVFTAGNFMDAVQTLSLKNYGSTNSLASLDDYSSPGTAQRVQLMLPSVLRFVIDAFDEFMHNHNPTEETGTAGSGRGTGGDISSIVFPKLC